MHLPNILLSAAPVGLFLLGLGQCAPLGDDHAHTLVARQPPDTLGFDGWWIYRGDGRDPATIRAQGGFQPQGSDYADDPEAYNLQRHYIAGPNGAGLDESDEPGFVFRTIYVSTSSNSSVSSNYGNYIYRIRATPNAFNAGHPEEEIMVAGGIPWRQIAAYATLSGEPGNRVIGPWELNTDYDSSRDNDPLCRWTTAVPEEVLEDEDYGQNGEMQAVLELMDDWLDMEFIGQFPFDFTPPAPALPGHVPAPRTGGELVEAARYLGTQQGPCEISEDMWQHWLLAEADYTIQEALARMHQRGGLQYQEDREVIQRAIERFRQGQEATGICHLFTGCGFTGSGLRKRAKKEVPANLQKFCKKLNHNYYSPRTCIKGTGGVCKYKKRNPCTQIETLLVTVRLSSDHGAGTWDDLYISMGQQTRKLFSGPSAREHVTVSIPLSTAFPGSDGHVRLRSIDRVVIQEVQTHWSRGDAWELKSLEMEARCYGQYGTLVMRKFGFWYKWYQYKGEDVYKKPYDHLIGLVAPKNWDMVELISPA